jgi:hypothetical protein
MDRGWVDPHSRSGCGGEENGPCLCWKSNACLPARWLVILTELLRFKIKNDGRGTIGRGGGGECEQFQWLWETLSLARNYRRGTKVSQLSSSRLRMPPLDMVLNLFHSLPSLTRKLSSPSSSSKWLFSNKFYTNILYAFIFPPFQTFHYPCNTRWLVKCMAFLVL